MISYRWIQCTSLLIFCWPFLQGQDSLFYALSYKPGESHVWITIDSLQSINPKLVIPRSAPGTYDLVNYMAFVSNVVGETRSGDIVKGRIGDGSYFLISSELPIVKVKYSVDLVKMEQELLGGFSSSKIRENYVGILGYSIFGFVEDTEARPIHLEIKTHPDWPIFSTLKPSNGLALGKDYYRAQRFSILADAQYMLGEDVQVIQISEARIPFYVAVYAETDCDIVEIGRRGMNALHGLGDYFGYIPMPHYTMVYEYLIPVSERHDYGFSMEHLNSMTATADTSSAIDAYDPEANIGSIVHHIGHSWIPLRSYGEGYRPFAWQVAPVIETIWLNEGFIWYIAYYHILERKGILNFFNTILKEAPQFIKQKSLQELSALGSTQYSLDFRIGKNLFARGALLAWELDQLIQQSTEGEKSIREALLGLLKWTELNQRAYTYEEIEPILSNAVNVDLKAVWDKWQGPQK